MITVRARFKEELKEHEEDLQEKENILKKRQEQQRIKAESIELDKKRLKEMNKLYEDKKEAMKQQLNEQENL